MRANLSTSTKTVVDTTSAGAYVAGDVLQYTITITETRGLAASGVSVTDTIHTYLTLIPAPITYPAGATNSSTASALNITGINIPANGSVTIVYSATISSSATPGTTISNTATINNPGGAGASPVAPVVTVTGTVAGTGNKPLYLYGGAASPYKMSRYPTPGTPTTTAIAANGGSAIWNGNWNGLASTTFPCSSTTRLRRPLPCSISTATPITHVLSQYAFTVPRTLRPTPPWPSAALATEPPRGACETDCVYLQPDDSHRRICLSCHLRHTQLLGAPGVQQYYNYRTDDHRCASERHEHFTSHLGVQ